MSNKNYPFVARGNQRYVILRSKTFNIDNGSGTTDDDVLCANLPSDAVIVSIQPVYIEATDTAGAAGANYKVGTTVGGVDIVAQTALQASKAVGAVGAAATLVASLLSAGSSLFARHTGIAATEAGQYYLQVILMLKP